MYADESSKDPVLLTIDGKNIYRSEFEFSFDKFNLGKKVNDKAAIDNYMKSYVDYKLKVRAAIDNKIDTLASFKRDYSSFRDRHLKKYLIDSLYIDSVARKVYDKVKATVGDSDLLLLSHILLSCTQKSSEEAQQKAKLMADSIYALVKAGQSFSSLAQKFSTDRNSSRKGGELPWLGPNSSLPEFMKVAYSLKPGEVSKPFLTTAGYDIIKMLDRKPLESYSDKKDEILIALKSSGVDDQAMESGIQKMVASSNGTLTRDDVIQNAMNKANADNPRLKYMLNEYRDGLLMYEATDNLVWKPAAKDKQGMASFFKKNIKKYTWKTPRFKGFLLLAKKKEILEKAKKIVAPFDNRNDAVKELKKQLGPKDSRAVLVKYSIYKEGDDARVDHMKFGKPAPKAHKMLPYYDVVGQMMSKPLVYTDDYKRVLSDYQNQKEQEWLSSLRKKYLVKIDGEVLKTVNGHSE